VLDAVMQEEELAPPAAESGLSPHVILDTVDGLGTAGFVDHLRLPHYASFAAYIDRLRAGGLHGAFIPPQ
jgi:alpha-D-ribose 1-methylphosphonate 5-triphosphate synthase subunit PhnI